jgi:hypothetical protein
MPPNPERRAQLLDAAIDILADTGVGGLTHRLVDERAGLPSGTTSNYFRTWLAPCSKPRRAMWQNNIGNVSSYSKRWSVKLRTPPE